MRAKTICTIGCCVHPRRHAGPIEMIAVCSAVKAANSVHGTSSRKVIGTIFDRPCRMTVRRKTIRVDRRNELGPPEMKTAPTCMPLPVTSLIWQFRRSRPLVYPAFPTAMVQIVIFRSKSGPCYIGIEQQITLRIEIIRKSQLEPLLRWAIVARRTLTHCIGQDLEQEADVLL